MLPACESKKRHFTSTQKSKQAPEYRVSDNELHINLLNYVLNCIHYRNTCWHYIDQYSHRRVITLLSILKVYRGYTLLLIDVQGFCPGYVWAKLQRLIITGEAEMGAFCCKHSKASWEKKKGGVEEDRSMVPVAKSRKE